MRLRYVLFAAPFALVALAALLRPSFAPSAQAPPEMHPLDPLTKEEITAAVGVLKEVGKLGPDTRFATIYLKEPPKDRVLADLAAGQTGRAAFALLYNWSTRVTSEAVVDVNQRALLSWNDLEPNDPPLRSVIINHPDEMFASGD